MNLLSTYDRFSQAYPVKGQLASMREAGHQFALKAGLPTKQDEAWHYTSVKILNDVNFMPSAFNPVEPSHDTLRLIKERLNPNFTNIVFFNGALNATLSEDLPAGLSLQEMPEKAEVADTFEALNNAYLLKPFAVKVAASTSVDKPVNFVFFTSVEGGPALMVHPRLYIEVGARSSVQFLESYYGNPGVSYFVNSVTDLKIGESAKVIYIRLQAETENAINIGRSSMTLEKSAHLESLAFSTGAGLARHSLDLALVGPGSTSQVLGVYTAQGSQHIDNTTLIDHTVGECDSQQLYKGILGGQSKGAFTGKVHIRKNAQKANSAQLNNNLLLSTKAEADSKPVLEIYADDVKAAHGSTVGQLNKDELFYLLSRAIPKKKAIPMLSYGFLSEVVYRISHPEIQQWLTRHLDEAFAKLSMEQS